MSWFRKPSSTPLWRDEFSVYTADERYVNRRQFTKFLTLTSFGMFAGNLWILARSVFHRLPSYPQCQWRPLTNSPWVASRYSPIPLPTIPAFWCAPEPMPA